MAQMKINQEIMAPLNSCTYTFLTIYLIESPFDTFANRADPDQAALVRAA